MAGRPAKPKAQAELEDYRKDRINYNEPKFKPTKGECPEWLTEDQAKEIWHTLGPELEELGLLTIADRDAFATYCWLCAQCISLAKYIDKNKSVHITPNEHRQPRAEVSMLREFLKLKRSLAQEFGLSPGSRVKLSVLPKTSENPEFESTLD